MKNLPVRLVASILTAASLATPALAQTAPLEIRELKPPTGTGYSVKFRVRIADSNAGMTVTRAGIRISPALDSGASPTCTAYWDRNEDAFYMARPQGWVRAQARTGAPIQSG